MQLKINRPFIIFFAVIGLFATLVGFCLRGAMLTGDVSGMTDPEMLGLLWTTPVGTAFVLRVVGLGLLIVGVFLGRRGLLLSTIGGIIALWSFAHIGHIPDRDSIMLNLILLFHLVAVCFWIGVLSPLRKLSLHPAQLPEAVSVGHRFGRLAMVLVPLLVLAGLYMGYVLVGTLSALVNGAYGRALIIKVILVGGLLTLAAANKMRFIPRMQAGDHTAARHLARSILVEWGVFIVILSMTAILTSVLTLPM
ncbi:CopD family protein [Yoonia sp. F2084L]|uniref:copper resistance D family protein n=1 Tax=Yoonia sp. F2084L TaxID=2926419 RepID=UPI001FF68173|nr:CopD family protein [Yoonia sp. F2084L]MCK0095210.1 CopD family protein [Yoonia sp. F2084L]